MKKIFVYTNEIFNSELLVCVGVTTEEIKKWAKKNSKNLTAILKDETNFKTISGAMKGTGLVYYFVKDELRYYLLWLRDYDVRWDKVDTLNHEIVHYRQFQFKDKGIEGEIEFEAYFEESVFRAIRQRLSSYIKK